jgi:hypothetical protein
VEHGVPAQMFSLPACKCMRSPLREVRWLVDEGEYVAVASNFVYVFDCLGECLVVKGSRGEPVTVCCVN